MKSNGVTQTAIWLNCEFGYIKNLLVSILITAVIELIILSLNWVPPLD